MAHRLHIQKIVSCISQIIFFAKIFFPFSYVDIEIQRLWPKPMQVKKMSRPIIHAYKSSKH